ncbi:MAG: hypothetical protein HC838_10610 [Spirulinaceae cyanobacterium RM2_2_10]|nr:hypothetical protein [Spirulinaceae cyanobacterium RM2_2_10]
MNKIQEIIERLDQPNQQVMIESKFVEVTKNDIKDIGVNWASLSGYGVSAGPFERQWERNRSKSDSSSTNVVDNESLLIPGGFSSEDTTSITETLANLAATGRFDLQLAGHSHGGQVRLPLIGPPFLPPYGREYPLGRYQFGDTIHYTNRGLGMTILPIRWRSRPEITVFTLRSPLSRDQDSD